MYVHPSYKITYGQFLSNGIILGFLSRLDLFLYTVTLPTVMHPLPSLVLLLKFRQEYSYRLKTGH
jgi:hypothetical protein